MLYISTETTLPLEKQLDRIALEVSLSLPSFSSLRDFLPNFISLFKVNNDKLDTSIKEYGELYKDLPDIAKKALTALDKINFVNLSNVAVSVPENFKGNMLNYIQTMNTVMPEIFNLTQKSLDDYNAMLSVYITNSNAINDLQDHTLFYSKIKNQREKANDVINAYFPISTGVTKSKLIDICSDPHQLKKIILNYRQEPNINKSLKSLLTNVKKSSDYLDILSQKINKIEDKHLSAYAARNISTGAYEIGKLVELNSILCFRNTLLLHSITKLIDTIMEAEKGL
jgi:hypothetical protein